MLPTRGQTIDKIIIDKINTKLWEKNTNPTEITMNPKCQSL
jgi:hypothetical protein